MTGRGRILGGWAALLLLLAPGWARAGGREALGLASTTPAAGNPGEEGHRKNLRTLGLTLLLPGLAHVIEGEKTRGTAYMVAEAGFWTGFASFRVQGNHRKDSYVQMAQINAGVERPGGRSEEYYRLLGNWPSSDLYDEYVTAREARSLYPNDLAARAAYLEAHRIPADEAWRWESQAAWDRYRAKRSDSQQSYRRGRNVLALAVANRVVALLDAAIFLRAPGRAESWRLEMTPGETPLSAELRLRYSLP